MVSLNYSATDINQPFSKHAAVGNSQQSISAEPKLGRELEMDDCHSNAFGITSPGRLLKICRAISGIRELTIQNKKETSVQCSHGFLTSSYA